METADQKEMSFFDHLEELRWDVIKSLIGLLVGTAICVYFADFIVQVLLLRPLKQVGLKTQVLSPYGIVMLYMEAVMVGGFIISMPNTLYWMWKFVSPGLMPKERRYASRIVGFTSFFFLVGVAFGYYVLLPGALDFFAHFGTQMIEMNIAIDRYVSFVLTLILGAGLVFELPMVTYFLSKFGILTPAFMRHYRRHAIVIIFIIAAVVTPTPDMVTQTLLALPMIALYEVSIFVSKYAQKKEEPPAEEAA
jgi:sec-independent protein translocase protein TatC